MNTYIDTRGRETKPRSFTEAIVKGIAEGGGLFVPEEVPRLTLDEILSFGSLPYHERAALVYKRFGVDLPAERIAELMRRAYGENFDDERIAPLAHVTPGIDVLELWHGPTSAFKDMALQCMPLFFSASIDSLRADREAPHDFLILVATSGDTGTAALNGFAERDHIRIAVLYPADGVSDIQRKQMVTQTGDNVVTWGVHGNFDDCQTTVKRIFGDADFNARLAEEHGLVLSSANSINWGRLLPQIVYYIGAYADMVAAGSVAAGDAIDVCVPTGNFGNILAAYYARVMGVPIERLVCASNENRILSDFIATGTYDISDRPFVVTPSPSMDILISSNLERLLFELTDRDADRVAGWMDDLARDKRFAVDRQTFARIRELFVGDYVTNEESFSTIRRVHNEHGYLLDPHTAVAWEVGERFASPDERPMLVASTAHWAKFGGDVFRALTGIAPGDPLPESAAGLTGARLNDQVVRLVGEAAGRIPESLSSIDEKPIRFTGTLEADVVAVEDALLTWLSTA